MNTALSNSGLVERVGVHKHFYGYSKRLHRHVFEQTFFTAESLPNSAHEVGKAGHAVAHFEEVARDLERRCPLLLAQDSLKRSVFDHCLQ